MSSLRLALKQSLQESGGGTFSSGNGDKKKRKKKKSVASNTKNPGKRKRGRPRKHPREEDEMTLEDSKRQEIEEVDDDDDDDDDEEEFSDNELSDYDNSEDYDESDEDDDDDDDDDDMDEDSDHESPHRRRSREMDPEEEGELDEGMHSDEDTVKKTKSERGDPPTIAEKPQATKALEDKKDTTAAASETDPTSEDEMMRKKLKLLKLKKRLEKNQKHDSAATKIQSQWKKKKGKVKQKEGTLSYTEGSTESTTAQPVSSSESGSKDKVVGSAVDGDSKTLNAPIDTGAPSEAASPTFASQKPNDGTEESSQPKSGDSKTETSSKKEENAVAKSLSTKSSAAAGDRGNTKGDSGGEEPKKHKKNGYVPAPSREVKEWHAQMSVKKSRKYIRVGMRVKVRFKVPVKKDGKTVTKKKFYGGEVGAIGKKRNKIRIKYDDGTKEVTEFPDQDVYVDAVDNGEHAVPADKFIPQWEEEETEEAAQTQSKPAEEQEEGEIPAAPATIAVEAEEGEVKEDAQKALTDNKSKPSSPLPQTIEEAVAPAKEVPEAPTNAPSTPLPASSSPALPTAENTDAVGTSKDDVQMEPVPSQEEGELSPGITVSKGAETIAEDKQSETTPMETEPLIPKELLPSNLGSEKPTTEPIKFADEQPSKPTDESSNQEAEKSNDEADAPSKPKKLSIRIPSNSLATIKSLSTPTGGKSPKIAASDTPAVVNEILEDTPEPKKEVTAKRKRLEDAAPVVEEASGEEPPAKRRIKVALQKTVADATVSKEPSDEAPPKPLETVAGEELAVAAEEPISGAETKKKKKKGDRAKSPRPKSPMPVPEPEKVKSKSNDNTASDATAAVTPKQKIGSKGSAFSAKKAKEENAATLSKQTSAEDLLNASDRLRTGRKAAEEAKEKLSAKQKAKLNAKELKEKEAATLESAKKSKKKRRREKEAEEEGQEYEEVEPSELEWVQCDNCKKWRVLPDNVKAASLPDLWYCQMNVYDPKRSKCEAPEQNMKQVQRERKKRARKKAKLEAQLAESQQEKTTKKSKQLEEEAPPKKKTKQEKLQAAAGTPRSTSPKPGKSGKPLTKSESKKALAEAKREKVEGGKKSKEDGTDSGSDTPKEVKKKGKKGRKEAQDGTDNQDADDPKKGGRKRGRPSRNQTASTPLPASTTNAGEDEDNVEWVQCDKCEKWRKLPPHISADELPDIWNCSMNTWNPSAASCDAAEDKADAHHQEVGATEWQLRQTHAGKYSYRQMIFGTGARKHNRPMSERARAAESLFKQEITEEQPYPTTQYTKSSAFLPRLSNFDKRNAVEENPIGIFDVLRHSNLWEDLRTMDMKPSKVLSTSTSALNIPGQKLKTYDSLPEEIKHAMQDVVLQTLEFGCLTGDEITGKAQWFPYETSMKGVAGIRGYCNEDIIIHTLLDLVRDGLVEMATVKDPYAPVSQWVPRYRRVGTRRAFEAVEAIKASRCMKIAKPWKQRPSKSTTTEWVTGQN